MVVEIRPARPADAAQLAELRWEFRAGREAPSASTLPREPDPREPHEAFIARCAAWMEHELGGSGMWRAWVARNEERIVGQVWLHTIVKVPNPIGESERHAYLSNLYVMPAMRGGVGTRLLDAALAQASADGVDRVVLWPSARSRSLYLRRGFTPNGEVLELACR